MSETSISLLIGIGLTAVLTVSFVSTVTGPALWTALTALALCLTETVVTAVAHSRGRATPTVSAFLVLAALVLATSVVLVHQSVVLPVAIWAVMRVVATLTPGRLWWAALLEAVLLTATAASADGGRAGPHRRAHRADAHRP